MFQADHAAIDINIYKVVHTGANNHEGGLKFDKIRLEYHGSLNSDVTKPPIKDAKNVMASNRINDKYLFLIK